MPSARLLLSCLALGAVACGCDVLQARSLARQGVERYDGGDAVGALGLLEQAAALEPDHRTIQRNLGFAALAAFHATTRPELAQPRGATAVAAFGRYSELVGGGEQARSFLVGALVDTGRYDDAVALFGPLASAEPPDAEALAILASVAAKTGRAAEAVRWQERRVQAFPASVDARVALGATLWDSLHRAVELGPEARLAASSEPVAQLEEALRLEPDRPDAHTYLNLVLRERALGQPTEELQALDRAEATRHYQRAAELTKEKR